MPILTHNHGDIYYEVVGSGEPVVLIHGFTLDHTMWSHQVAFLSQNHKVISYDARGFGKSSIPKADYSHVDDLQALFKQLDIHNAHIIGLSMGGRIAINFTLAYPMAVASLTLMDAALDGYDNEVDWNVHAKEAGIKQAKENWLNHDIFTATREQPKVMQALSIIVENYSGWHWLNKDTLFPRTTQARFRLSALQQPVLVIVGEKDLPYFHNIANVLEAGIARAQKAVILKAGHMVNMEAPAIVNGLIGSFIASNATSAK